MLDIAEKDTVFVLFADPYVGPMTYLHYVEGRRPNLRLLEYHGLVFSDKVVNPLTTTEQKTAAWARISSRCGSTGVFPVVRPGLLGGGPRAFGIFCRSQ